jgi:outer membrane lipoprotein-sorting protein
MLARIIFTAAFALALGISMAGQTSPPTGPQQGAGQGQGQGNQPAPPQNVGKPAEDVFKNIQILKGAPASQIIPAMNFMAASLGVECTFCHVSAQGEFEKDDKTEKQTARKMMTMMFAINKDSFNGRRQVTCNSCHNGHSQPQAIPLVASARPAPAPAPAPVGAPGATPSTTPPPTVDQILEKYVQALGGKEAIEKITSRVAKGTISAGNFKAPLETYGKAPGRLQTILHLPQGDQIQVFDGTTVWTQGPGAGGAAPEPWQVARAKREADLQSVLHLKDYFTRLRLGRIEKIGDRDAYLVIAFREGDSPLRFYFDTQSGLLLRIFSTVDTPLGASPTQVDYEDYRAVDGVQVAFRQRFSRPDATVIHQFDDIKQNIPVDDSKFVKPAPAAK